MRVIVVVVCAVVGVLGIITAALGFAAESKRIKESDVIVGDSTCQYPENSPSVALGVLAALLLLAAQILLNIAGCCICCRNTTTTEHPTPTSRRYWTIALTSLVISWIVFLIAFTTLLAAAAANAHYSKDGTRNKGYRYGSCYVVRTGVFLTGAFMSLLTVALGIFSYIAFERNHEAAAASFNPQQSQGVAMGIPHPATFVNEDNYLRRQHNPY